jgi:isocitrate dehydrogenase
VYTPQGGGDPTTLNVYDFKGKGVALAMYNTDDVSPVAFLLVEMRLTA